MNERRRYNSEFGFGINDCPIWLWKEYAKDAKERFNDCYWAKLYDLYVKAEAYENIVKLGIVPAAIEEEPVVEEKEEKVKTFGGID